MEVPIMSHAPTGNSHLLLFLLLILAATGCGESRPKQGDGADEPPNSGGTGGATAVPKDLVGVAITFAQDNCLPKPLECKDHRIAPVPRNRDDLERLGIVPLASFAAVITDADRANGIEDKWCVVVAYLLRVGAEPWRDGSVAGIYIKRSGAWQNESAGQAGFIPTVFCRPPFAELRP